MLLKPKLKQSKIFSSIVGDDLSGLCLVSDPRDDLSGGVILVVLTLGVLQHELGARQLGALAAGGILVDDDVEGVHVHSNSGFLEGVLISGVIAVLERSGVGFLVKIGRAHV